MKNYHIDRQFLNTKNKEKSNKNNDKNNLKWSFVSNNRKIVSKRLKAKREEKQCRRFYINSKEKRNKLRAKCRP